MSPEAEKFNGWAAMLGFVAAFGAYATTGQIIPGIFQEIMNSAKQVVTEYGKQNMFGIEAQPQIVDSYSNYPEEAEKANGRWAMIGMIALFGAYLTTGQLLPGIF